MAKPNDFYHPLSLLNTWHWRALIERDLFSDALSCGSGMLLHANAISLGAFCHEQRGGIVLIPLGQRSFIFFKKQDGNGTAPKVVPLVTLRTEIQEFLVPQANLMILVFKMYLDQGPALKPTGFGIGNECRPKLVKTAALSSTVTNQITL